VEGQAHLPHVAEAGHALRLGLGLGERRQQQGGQNGDDGDDHQQFNQREGAWTPPRHTDQGTRLHEFMLLDYKNVRRHQVPNPTDPAKFLIQK